MRLERMKEALEGGVAVGAWPRPDAALIESCLAVLPSRGVQSFTISSVLQFSGSIRVKATLKNHPASILIFNTRRSP